MAKVNCIVKNLKQPFLIYLDLFTIKNVCIFYEFDEFI